MDPEVVQELREEQRLRLWFTSGPLPPPETLAKYAKLVPDLPGRLIRLLENQTAHRQARETEIVRANISGSHRGQWLAFATAATGIGAAVVTAWLGHPAVATAITTSV